MLKKYVFSVFLILVLALVSFSSALAGSGVFPVKPLTPPPSVETGEKVFENRTITGIWFVELSGAPVINGNSINALETQHATFRQQAQKAGIIYTERQSFETLWNGFTVEADVSQVGKLKNLPGVVNVFPVQVIKMPETTIADPDLFTALNMTGADIVQSELGYTGAGIKVGIIDTGVDVNHPALGGDGIAEENSSFFYSNPRIPYGWDFVGDDYNADDPGTIAVPDEIPDDCAGHGTHVAGIVGANDSTNDMKGVAPDVTLGAYRVFGCAGSTTDEVMLMAMEMAFHDGMQIINMSIGSPYDWPQAPTAVASTNLVNRGMVVVASIGNSGAYGLYSAGAPGLGDKVIGVASFDNTNVYLPYFEVNGTHVGYITMAFSAAAPTSGTEAIESVGGNGLGCTTPFANDVTGKAALIKRGTCSFAVKAANAIASGATSVVIYNNTSGVLNGTLGASLGSSVPVVGISKAQGEWMLTQLPANLTWTDQLDSFASPTGGLISSFSSYGLAPDLALKPDLGAPGGNIYSSYPLEAGGYATLSGTSMSSPHVAGAAALFLQAHPATLARDVRTYLQNNAEPAPWWGNPGLGFLDNVNRQGAGKLQIDKAILATSRVEPSKLALGESQAGVANRALAITNSGSKPVTYRFSFVNALSVGNTFVPSFSTSDSYVTFSVAKITIYPGSTKNIMATIRPSTGPKLAQYGGYIVISGSDGSVMRVPYAGFIGNYQAIKAITPTAYGFPWLGISIGGDFYGPVTGPSDWVYTMVGEDVPYLLIHFDHQVTKLQVQIYNASTGLLVDRAYNYAFIENYLPRNSTSSGFYAFSWDGNQYMYNTVGTTFFRVAPDGQYILKLKALKALGNPAVASDWETWTSPVVEIDRP